MHFPGFWASPSSLSFFTISIEIPRNQNFHWRQDGLRYQASGESSSVSQARSRIERTCEPHTKSYRYPNRCAEQPPALLALKIGCYGLGIGLVVWSSAHSKQPGGKHKPVEADLLTMALALGVVMGVSGASLTVQRDWSLIRPLQTSDLAPDFNLRNLERGDRVTLESWSESWRTYTDRLLGNLVPTLSRRDAPNRSNSS